MYKNLSLLKTGRQLLLSTVLLFSIALFSCEDDAASVGSGILPTEDNLTGFLKDDINIISQTVENEPILTSQVDFGIIGDFNDPVFGNTKASFLSQVKTSSNFYNSHQDTLFYKRGNSKDTVSYQTDTFKTFSIESAYLRIYLKNASWYGAKIPEHLFNVYSINELIDGSGGELLKTDYYSDFNIEQYTTEENLLGSLLYTPINIIADSTQALDTILIPLKDDILNKFRAIEADSLWGGDVPNEIIFDIIKGYVITAENNTPEEGALYRITASTPEILLKQKVQLIDATNKVNSTLYKEIVFRSGSSSPFINIFRHDNSTITNPIALNNSSSDKLYLQGCGNTMAHLMLDQDALLDWKAALNNESNNTISSVRLIMPVDTTTSDFRNYNIPSNIILYRKKESGELENIGTSTFQNYSYVFNFSIDFFNSILGEDTNNATYLFDNLYIKTVKPAERYERVVLNSSSHEENPLRLEIRYITFN